MPAENTSLKYHFSYKDVRAKCLKATCLHCDIYINRAKNPTREQQHIHEICLVLKAEREAAANQLNSATKRLRQGTLDGDFVVPQMSSNWKARIDRELATCLY